MCLVGVRCVPTVFSSGTPFRLCHRHHQPPHFRHHLHTPGRSTTTFGRNIDRTEWNTEPTEPIFGRTDLRKGVSEAKFDVEADFDVKKSLAPPKSAENHEKPKKKIANKIRKKNCFRIFFSIRNRNKNRRKRSFFSIFFRDFFSVFRDFREILEELGIF